MSRVRTWTDEDFIDAVADNYSVASALRSLELSATGANYQAFYLNCERLGVDHSHFTGKAWNRGKSVACNTGLPLDHYLVENSKHRLGSNLKKRVIAAGLLENKCQICGIEPYWNGMTLVMSLDHINGKNLDHRIENLRLICPNCHTQTDTFAGKNKKSKKISLKKRKSYYRSRPKKYAKKVSLVKKYKKCESCKVRISDNATRCKSCARKAIDDTKIQWPSIEELGERLAKSNYSKLGRELGVSDNAIRKRLRNHG